MFACNFAADTGAVLAENFWDLAPESVDCRAPEHTTAQPGPCVQKKNRMGSRK